MSKPLPKKPISQEAESFFDKYDLMHCECPKCQLFIPNVKIGQDITCPGCKWIFKVVKR